MVSVYEFDSYRKYLEAWIQSQSSQGYGLKLRIAEALEVSSSLVSQVLSGRKTFTSDQTSHLCDFIGLNETESDFLHLLVESDRAASLRYREKLERKIRAMRAKSQKIGSRVPRDRELTDEQKAIYYSSWLYTGIRNLTALPAYSNVNSIAERLAMDPGLVNKTIQFLIENGLCREVDGAITYGPAALHVDKDSPFVGKHHQNWRLQAIQKMERKRDEDLFFTGPMSLSREALKEIRALLPTVIERIMKISGPSESETVACINLDLFEY
jgi:uncharacterized protein (TIGR02147 family)